MQNWQSGFSAVAAIVELSIFRRHSANENQSGLPNRTDIPVLKNALGVLDSQETET
jgi:hypothetical protein